MCQVIITKVACAVPHLHENHLIQHKKKKRQVCLWSGRPTVGLWWRCWWHGDGGTCSSLGEEPKVKWWSLTYNPIQGHTPKSLPRLAHPLSTPPSVQSLSYWPLETNTPSLYMTEWQISPSKIISEASYVFYIGLTSTGLFIYGMLTCVLSVL